MDRAAARVASWAASCRRSAVLCRASVAARATRLSLAGAVAGLHGGADRDLCLRRSSSRGCSRPAIRVGLAGIFGYGGWWSIPAAVCVGLVLGDRVPRRPLGAGRGRAAPRPRGRDRAGAPQRCRRRAMPCCRGLRRWRRAGRVAVLLADLAATRPRPVPGGFVLLDPFLARIGPSIRLGRPSASVRCAARCMGDRWRGGDPPQRRSKTHDHADPLSRATFARRC